VLLADYDVLRRKKGAHDPDNLRFRAGFTPKRSRVNRARCENGFPASPQRELNGKGESLTVGKTGKRRRGMNIRLPFRLVCALALASILTALPTVPSLAHHGWSWTDEEIFELEGTITEIYVGNPHATLDVDVAGEIWRVELAPPSQTVRAGFSEEAARPGDTVKAIGNRSRDHSERRMKAVRIIVNGTTYDVYPNRVPSQ